MQGLAESGLIDVRKIGMSHKRMRRYRSAILAALALALSYETALAADPGDAARGLGYTRKFCDACHGINAKDQASPNPEAPTFKAIANTPGMTRTALLTRMQHDHPFVLLDDRDDVIAYILSLKDSGASGKH
jgi:mono/diheme cytochrome c family protein